MVWESTPPFANEPEIVPTREVKTIEPAEPAGAEVELKFVIATCLPVVSCREKLCVVDVDVTVEPAPPEPMANLIASNA